MKAKKYLANGFLLLVPIFAWNILLFEYLPKSYQPEIFWKNIPPLISYGENISRVFIFALPMIMALSFKSPLQKVGLTLYLVGVMVYFVSWLFMILYPESAWSKSEIGFMAPAFTTIIWLVGIGLIGHRPFIRIPMLPFIYIALSVIFVLFHTWHTYWVYHQLL